MKRGQSVGRRHGANRARTLLVLFVVLASSCGNDRADSLPANCVKTTFDLGRPTESKPSTFQATGGDIYVTITDSQNDEGIEFPVGNQVGGGPGFKIFPKDLGPKAYGHMEIRSVPEGLLRMVELTSGSWGIASSGAVRVDVCAPMTIGDIQVLRR